MGTPPPRDDQREPDIDVTELGDASREYLQDCPSCMCEYDALQAAWCSCDAKLPTKMCPFCLSCVCNAAGGRDRFWADAPLALRKEKRLLKDCRMLFGDILQGAGVITAEELAQGLALQQETGMRFGDALVSLNILTRAEIDDFLKLQETVVTFDLASVVLDLPLIHELGVEFCRSKRILPLEKETFQDRTFLTLAMADPSDNETIDLVQKKNGCQVLPGRAPEEEILATLDAQG